MGDGQVTDKNPCRLCVLKEALALTAKRLGETSLVDAAILHGCSLGMHVESLDAPAFAICEEHLVVLKMLRGLHHATEDLLATLENINVRGIA